MRTALLSRRAEHAPAASRAVQRRGSPRHTHPNALAERAPDAIGLASAPRVVAQRAQLHAMFGPAIQRAAVSPVVLQRALIPLTVQEKPGRLRDEEKTLKGLLEANAFALTDRQKARSDPAHLADLQARMQRVLDIEGQFQPGMKPADRRVLRAQLAAEYDQLVYNAGRYKADADRAYDDALTAEAQQIRAVNPAVNELFIGANPWRVAEPNIVMPARIATFADRPAYVKHVRTRYKKLYTPAPAAPAVVLSQADQATLTAERDAVTAQLGLWNGKRYDAQGCNLNGTWGTSKAGAGAAFAATHLSARIWAELKAWWEAKPGAYITPSDTSTWSLKKSRALPDDSPLSPTFNYHVWVP